MKRTLYTKQQNEACARIRERTGLTHRQLEYFVAIAAFQRAYNHAPKVFDPARLLASHPQLALVKAVPRHPNQHSVSSSSYQGALLRLVRVGYLRYVEAEFGRPCHRISVTDLGWSALEALRTGAPPPRDRIAAAMFG